MANCHEASYPYNEQWLIFVQSPYSRDTNRHNCHSYDWMGHRKCRGHALSRQNHLHMTDDPLSRCRCRKTASAVTCTEKTGKAHVARRERPLVRSAAPSRQRGVSLCTYGCTPDWCKSTLHRLLNNGHLSAARWTVAVCLGLFLEPRRPSRCQLPATLQINRWSH